MFWMGGHNNNERVDMCGQHHTHALSVIIMHALCVAQILGELHTGAPSDVLCFIDEYPTSDWFYCNWFNIPNYKAYYIIHISQNTHPYHPAKTIYLHFKQNNKSKRTFVQTSDERERISHPPDHIIYHSNC